MKVTADYRERSSGLIDLLNLNGAKVKVKRIVYGDYIINDAATIERKTANDFLISIIDGRLFNQLSHLKKYASNPILLVEGNPYKTNLAFDPRAIKGALLSTKTVWNIPVVYTASKEDTVATLIMIGRQYRKHDDVVGLRGGYRPKRLTTKQLYLLQGLPQVGPRLAKRLIGHFKSVSKVMNASVQELTAIDGIGNVTAEQIREVLDTETQL